MKKITILSVMAVLCLKKLKVESGRLRAKRPKLKGESLKTKVEKIKLKKLGRIVKTSLLIALLGMFSVSIMAQESEVAVVPTVIKPLKVGDKLPAAFWTQKHLLYSNGQHAPTNLAAYKDKLLVFDFWATWCGSCINKFRTVEELQAIFKDEVNFLLVNTKNTRDTVGQIATLLSGKKYETAPYQLTTVYEDTYIHQLFPYGYMPYYVIVSPSGEVRAIVPAELITATNMRLMVDAYAKKTKKGGGDD